VAFISCSVKLKVFAGAIRWGDAEKEFGTGVESGGVGFNEC
jgi:hypothetical protein